MKALIAGAVLIVLLLFTALLLTFARKPAQRITVRHIKSVQSGDLVTATFEITNHATSSYIVFTWWVEARNGPVWRRCFDFNPQPFLLLHPHGSEISTLEMTNLPTGSPLRLRMVANKELGGLEGLFLRLDFRFRRGQKQVSLNPFDKRAGVSGMPTQIVSDEFIVPEPEPTSKVKSEK